MLRAQDQDYDNHEVIVSLSSMFSFRKSLLNIASTLVQQGKGNSLEGQY